MTDSQSELDLPPRKRELLAAARACFVENGFESTPVSAIVRAAGVAQGTFYLYFDSKVAVVNELQRELVRDYERTLTTVASLPVPVDERLARIIVAMSVAVGRHIALERVFRAAGNGEAGLLAGREGRRRLARHAARLLEDDAALLSEDPERTAGFVVALFDQVLFEVHAFEPDAVDDVLRESLRFTLRGLGVVPDRVEHLIERRADFVADAKAA